MIACEPVAFIPLNGEYKGADFCNGELVFRRELSARGGGGSSGVGCLLFLETLGNPERCALHGRLDSPL